MKDVDKLNKIFGKTKEEALKNIDETTELGHGIKMKKKALLIFDDNCIKNSQIDFLISKNYCIFDRNYNLKKKHDKENKYNLPTNYMFSIDFEKVLKEYEYCISIKNSSNGNKIRWQSCTESFSAIYVNGELYLKIED